VFGMGIEGAAYGTVAAQALSAAFGLAFFWRKDTPLKIRREFIGLPKFDVLKRIISVGSTGFFVEISFVVYMTIMSRLVTKYGGDVGLSVLGIFFSLDSLLFLPAIAVGEAAQPIIGYNYGAGSPQRVEKVIHYALLMAVGFYIVTFGIAEIFTEPLIRLFTNDPKLIETGVSGLRIGYLALPFFGVAIVTGASLQGLGKGLPSLILSFVRNVAGLFIPITFMPRIFGYNGVWLSFPCSDLISGFTSIGFLVWVLRWLKTPEALKVK
ncbi:MAG: MATE family efflux transporter, partial [Synergistes sp.]|nr:MATE family efflux transporter [Synergistes sp.]